MKLRYSKKLFVSILLFNMHLAQSAVNLVAEDTGIMSSVNGSVTGDISDLVLGGVPPYNFVVTGTPVGGSVTIAPQGTFNFKAAPGFSGLGEFMYQVTDSSNGTAKGTVDVLISSPVTKDLLLEMCKNGLFAGDLNGQVSGGFAPYTFESTGEPIGGSAIINEDGTFSFTATSEFMGNATFHYKATDTLGTAVVGAVMITVKAPIVENASFTICYDTITSSLSHLASGGFGALTFSGPIGAVSGGGNVSINPDGTFTFTAPNKESMAPCTFVFEVADSYGYASTGLVTIHPNQAPRAKNASLQTCYQKVLIDVLANYISGGIPPYTFAIVGGAVNGSVAINEDGVFWFTPAAGFIGNGSFQYQVTDSSYPACVSNVGTITVAVKSCAPVPSPKSFYGALVQSIPR